MKNMVKKNQIMITALAIMIAIAGYLNFAGGKITEEEILTAGSDTIVSENQQTEDADVAALFEISDEDMEQAGYVEIESMDSDVVMQQENYLDETMDEVLAENMTQEVAENTESQINDSETPGEAVFTSTTNVGALSSAKLLKEQTRARNKETLL